MIVYKITNLINNKIYIGQTVLTLEKRWYNHTTKANRKSTMLISRSIAKYGAENFNKEIIDVANTQLELNEKEIFWINKLNARDINIGYNISKGGTGGNIIKNLSNKEDIYKKRAASNRGKKRTAEFKLSCSIRKKGQKLTKETKDKISKSLSGNTLSKETKEKIRISGVGRIHSEETKQKMSKSAEHRLNLHVKKKINIDDIIYDSILDASKKLNISSTLIHYRLNSDNKKYTNYKYEKN